MAVKNAIACDFEIVAGYDGYLRSWDPSGTETVPSTADYYVATTGNDTTGNGTESLPWLTIAKGISMMSAGQTLMVKDGTYAGTSNFVKNLPSGTYGNETRVFAETPFGVRVNCTTTISEGNNLLLLPNDYCDVDGIIFNLDASFDPEHIGYISGDYNRVTRCGFRRGGQMNAYAGWLVIHGNYNLIEDTFGVGGARYGFEQGGPLETCKYNIWRRCVGRMDWSQSAQPKRTFTTYGNDTGDGVSDMLYQNCIALDGNDVDTGRGGSPELKYSSLGCGKEAARVKHKGCIVANDYSAYAGIWVSTTGADGEATDCVVWGAPAGSDAIRADGNTPTINHITTNRTNAMNLDGAYSTPSDSLTSGTPTDVLNNTPGAVVMKKRGVSGSRYGETGYDTLTSEDLWPWPYQSTIKTVMSETNASPGTANSCYPNTNTTTRGFCAAGNGLYGGPITLSSYIWELTGTACPAQYAS